MDIVGDTSDGGTREGDRVFGQTFSIIPEELIDAPITDRAYRLYGLLQRYAGTDGRAFPGRKTLAERLGCSLSSLIRALDDLVAHGFLDIEHHYRDDGSQTSSTYHLKVRAGVSPVTGGGVTRDTGGCHQRGPNEREPVNESQGTTTRAAPLFAVRTPEEVFETDAWPAYPRKAGKAEAKRKFLKACEHASIEEVVAGIRRFAADPNLPTGDERQYIPHLATWLHQGRWEDGPLPPRRVNGVVMGPGPAPR